MKKFLCPFLLMLPILATSQSGRVQTDYPALFPVSEAPAKSEHNHNATSNEELEINKKAVDGTVVLAASPFSVAAKHGLTSSQYSETYSDMKEKGYRIQCISGYEEEGEVKFAAVWKKTNEAPPASFHMLTAAEYQDKYNSYKQQGYKLTFIKAFTAKGKIWYSAIWVKKEGPDVKGFHGMTSKQYGDKYTEMKEAGYRLAHISGVDGGDQANYSAIWEKNSGPARPTFHAMTSVEYQEKFDQYSAQGYRIAHLDAYVVNGAARFAAIWEKNSGPAQSAHHGMGEPNYQTTVLNYFYQGYTLGQTNAYVINGKPFFAATWDEGEFSNTEIEKIEKKINAFLKKYKVPGLTMAISKDEKLVFARGYGYADKEKNLLMGPQHIGRIASVSKPITSVAMQILAQKFPAKISMNSKVFGDGSIFGSEYGTKALSNNEKLIQVDNLLEHTAGGNIWDNNDEMDHLENKPAENPKTFDPMFQYGGKSHAQLITAVLDDRNPDYAPGTYNAYSNFGYCVVGRIIEKISGTNYFNWVKTTVLQPCGITQMYIAKNNKNEKRANEFALYGQDGDNPYGSDVARMDSHGGWLASPIELLRLAVRIDGKAGKTDIIDAAALKSMTTATSYTSNPVYEKKSYAKGWTLSDGGFSHNGLLPGSRSKLVIRYDGFSYSIIVNTATTAEGFASEFEAMVREIISDTKNWPKYDLF
jgi:CubicO group peptidase (beta-lactamase class C family)